MKSSVEDVPEVAEVEREEEQDNSEIMHGDQVIEDNHSADDNHSEGAHLEEDEIDVSKPTDEQQDQTRSSPSI